ncbi:MAG: carboxypeptidase-like regulatory domain-containing protein [Candidatus Acidiferrum sp.]
MLGGRWPFQGVFAKKVLSCSGGIVGLALLLISCGARAVSAQDVRASITGTITDPSGVPIAGATVTAKDADRGTSWPAAKSEVGICSILRVSAGTYSVKVEPNGFTTAVYPTFTLALNQAARVEVQMDVGAVTSTFGVRGITTLLQMQGKEMTNDLGCCSV